MQYLLPKHFWCHVANVTLNNIPVVYHLGLLQELDKKTRHLSKKERLRKEIRDAREFDKAQQQYTAVSINNIWFNTDKFIVRISSLSKFL